MKTVYIHLYTQSEPVIRTNVRNTYQKGDMFCVMQEGMPEQPVTVEKFPLEHIFRVTEIG